MNKASLKAIHELLGMNAQEAGDAVGMGRRGMQRLETPGDLDISPSTAEFFERELDTFYSDVFFIVDESRESRSGVILPYFRTVSQFEKSGKSGRLKYWNAVYRTAGAVLEYLGVKVAWDYL